MQRFQMTPITSLPVDRSQAGWDDGLENFGYTRCAALAPLPLAAETFDEAVHEARFHWAEIAPMALGCGAEGYWLVDIDTDSILRYELVDDEDGNLYCAFSLEPTS